MKNAPRAVAPPPDPKPPGYRRLVAACVLVLLAVTAIELTEARLAWSNTLHRNGRWTSSKVALETGVVGAVAFFVTPKALVHNRLDLAAWLGFEEVLYRDPIALDRLAGAFRLADEAYVTVLFGFDEAHGFTGVRFSRDPRVPSALVTGEADGRFTSKRPLGALPIGSGWNRFELRFADGRARVALNGRDVADLPGVAAREGRFGFRSGRRPVLIDDVAAEGRRRGQAVRVREGFRRTAGYAPTLALSLGALGLLTALAAALARGRSRWPVLILLNLTGCLLGAALQWIVEPHLARIHPRPGEALLRAAREAGCDSHIEYEPDVLLRLRAEAAAPPEAVRLVFLGSSQTAGVGATRRADPFVARIDRMLAARRPPGAAPVKTLNAGVVGDRAPALVARYFREFALLRPHVVVVDLGNNDGDARALGRALDALAAFNAARGVRTVLVLEANTLEGSHSDDAPDSWLGLDENHQAMRELAARRVLTVIDLHRAMQEHSDDGFVWWDKVHLTSFGNALAADVLYPAVAREVAAAEAARATR